jgi:hypothetical protein
VREGVVGGDFIGFAVYDILLSLVRQGSFFVSKVGIWSAGIHNLFADPFSIGLFNPDSNILSINTSSEKARQS